MLLFLLAVGFCWLKSTWSACVLLNNLSLFDHDLSWIVKSIVPSGFIMAKLQKYVTCVTYRLTGLCSCDRPGKSHRENTIPSQCLDFLYRIFSRYSVASQLSPQYKEDSSCERSWCHVIVYFTWGMCYWPLTFCRNNSCSTLHCLVPGIDKGFAGNILFFLHNYLLKQILMLHYSSDKETKTQRS